jgi:hypothetical protein
MARGGELAMLEEMLVVRKQFAQSGSNNGYELARICAHLGRKAEATTYLDTAFHANDYMVMTIWRGEIENLLGGYEPFEKLKTQVQERMQSSSAQEHRLEKAAIEERHLQ